MGAHEGRGKWQRMEVERKKGYRHESNEVERHGEKN